MEQNEKTSFAGYFALQGFKMGCNPSDMNFFDPPKKKKKPIISLEVLQGLFENGDSTLSQQFIRWKLWKKWSEYVGASVAAISEPVGYRKGTLYVWVKNSSWLQQLAFMLEPMKSSINQKLGFNYVNTIYLTMDRKKVPSSPEESDQLKKAVENLMKSDD